jgi:acyl carrier protein
MTLKQKREIRETIANIFSRALPRLEKSATAVDIFERGATSLTVVDLQLQVEAALGWSVETHLLMAEASIDGWVAAYSRARTSSEALNEPA